MAFCQFVAHLAAAVILLCCLHPGPARCQTSIILRHSFAEEQPSGAKICDLRNLLRLQGGHRSSGGGGRGDFSQFEFRPLDYPEKYLTVDQSTGEISARSRIDRESLCREAATCCHGVNPDCRLQATIGLVDRRQSTVFQEILQLELDVVDLNDNQPRWTAPVLVLKIPEHTPIGEKFKLPPADDPDKAPENTTQTYRLMTGNDRFRVSATFSPDPAVMPIVWLEVLADLDYETRAFHEILIHAVDGGSEPLTGSVTVNVSLTDINDNAPVFTHESRTVSIPESHPVNREVFRVTARDRDASNAGDLRYRFSLSASKAVLDDFSIDPNTGSIVAVRPLDFETRREYSIPVTVSDGKHLVETTVEVQLLNVNDNPPRITVKGILTDLQIRENSPVGTLIASVDVKDADDKAMLEAVTCFIEPSRLFGLLPLYQTAKHQFKIVSNVRFDRELEAAYQANVTCNDNGSPNREETLRIGIRVADENDNPPVFRTNPLFASLPENSETAPPRLVARMEADDRDVGVNAEMRYSLAPQSEAAFQIDRLSGAIAAIRSFDREATGQVNVTVFARDMGDSGDTERQFTATGTVIVTIEDVNDCRPEFSQRLYSFAVVENSPNRTLVGSVSATDCDTEVRHRTLVYRLGRVSSSSATNSQQSATFQVSPDGSVHTNTDNLDRETRRSHSFTVVADDQAGHSDTAQVSVEVLDLNDNAPRWVYPSDANLRLNITMHRPVGKTIARLHASDQDNGNNGTVVYSLVNPQPQRDNLFVVSPEGDLSLGRPVVLSKDVNLLHILVFNACDNGTPERLFSIKSMGIFITEHAPSYGLGLPRTSEGNLIIIIIMVIITLVVSVILIGAIFFLRCNLCCHGRGREVANGGGRKQQQQQQQQQHQHHQLMQLQTQSPDYQLSDGVNFQCGTLTSHHYKVQRPVSPLDNDHQLLARKTLLATGEGKAMLSAEDADSLDSGKGCSSDNGSRTVRSAKELGGAMGIDGKRQPPMMSSTLQRQHHNNHHQPMSTFRYNNNNFSQELIGGNPYQNLRHCEPDLTASIPAARPSTAVHFQQQQRSSRESSRSPYCDSATMPRGQNLQQPHHDHEKSGGANKSQSSSFV